MSEDIVIGAKKEFFTWLPNCIVYEWGLSAEALAAALYLNGKPSGWQARPFDVQARFNWGDHIWRRVSKELKSHNLLREEITQSGTKLWFELPEMNLTIKKSATVENRDPRIPDSGKSTPLANKDISKKDLLTDKNNIAFLKTKSELDNSLNLIARAEVQSIFDKMWDVYPLKKGKQQALRWMMGALGGKRREVAEKFAVEIYTGLMACVNEHAAQQEIKKQGADIWIASLPYLSTWLNNGRWRDGYSSPEQILAAARPRGGILDIDTVF